MMKPGAGERVCHLVMVLNVGDKICGTQAVCRSAAALFLPGKPLPLKQVAVLDGGNKFLRPPVKIGIIRLIAACDCHTHAVMEIIVPERIQSITALFDAADQASGGLDIDLQVLLSTARMRRDNEPAVEILTSNARYLYWTPAQMVAHHAVNGCNLQPGDLIGTGTISGPRPEELSSMLEFTSGGTKPVALPNGEKRGFLEDGDEVTFRGTCRRPGYAKIGFGSCVGRIDAADFTGSNRKVA